MPPRKALGKAQPGENALKTEAPADLKSRIGAGFRLGSWHIEPSLNRICRDGEVVHLEPKVMAVLAHLAQRPFEVVGKDELMAAVWPDTFVSEIALPRSISQLRRVLEDDARNPRFIETIPKAGYRLITAVEPMGECDVDCWTDASRSRKGQAEPAASVSTTVPPRSGQTGRGRRGLALAIVAAVIVFAPLGWWGLRRGLSGRPAAAAGVAKIDSLAVLPLRSLTPGPEEDYFTVALTDLLITDLAKISSLKVIAADSMLAYRDSDEPLSGIARKLDVDAVLRGTVMRVGDRVRITAQLVRAETEEHLWAESYERELTDLLALQTEITRSIAQGIQVTLSPAELAQLDHSRAMDVASLELYMRGRERWRRRIPEALQQAAELFRASLELDPANAQAWTGLADTHIVLASKGGDPDAMAAARREARQALELDPDLAEAHVSLAMIRYLADWDWEGAGRHFERALELKPGYSVGHQWYGLYLASMGRSDEAIAAIERALELDPVSPIVRFHAGQIYYRARRYDAALREMAEAIRLGPVEFQEEARLFVGLIHLLRGETDLALAAFEGIEGSHLAEVLRLREDEGLETARRRVAEIAAATTGTEHSHDEIYLHLMVDDLPGALDCLKSAAATKEGWLLQLVDDPLFAPLHDEPRFRAVVTGLGLRWES